MPSDLLGQSVVRNVGWAEEASWSVEGTIITAVLAMSSQPQFPQKPNLFLAVPNTNE